MVAENANRYPYLLQHVREADHTIGNHTYHHLKGYKTCLTSYLRDIADAHAVLQTHHFRPPHGRMTYSQKKALREAGYQIYLWDVLTHDYNPQCTPAKILRIVQHFTRNGSIIVFHDSLKSKDRMLQALPKVIEWLQAEGYSIQPLPNP